MSTVPVERPLEFLQFILTENCIAPLFILVTPYYLILIHFTPAGRADFHVSNTGMAEAVQLIEPDLFFLSGPHTS